MTTMTKTLLALEAKDIMSQTVLVVPEDMSLQGAARRLSHHQVSGAPVVDEEGRCVGVLSATDFVRWAEKGAPLPHNGTCCLPWQIINPEVLPADSVRRYMTADPVMASPGTGIRELARMMLDAHIHRVIVVDEESRPIGVVSSMDVLAALAYAEKVE
jgi:CBS domain-containing protein